MMNVRYAIGTLARAPGCAVRAVLTLAVGIGATTAMFSILDGVLWKPLPYHDPDRLYLATPFQVKRRGGEHEQPVDLRDT
jgi:hypothetical protein